MDIVGNLNTDNLRLRNRTGRLFLGLLNGEQNLRAILSRKLTRVEGRSRVSKTSKLKRRRLLKLITIRDFGGIIKP